MLTNYPFFFAREEPIKASEAPEWYQNRKKRTDGVAEKNDHAKFGGLSFPGQFSSVGTENMLEAAKRDADLHVAESKFKTTKLINTQLKERIRKDNIQNCKFESLINNRHLFFSAV